MTVLLQTPCYKTGGASKAPADSNRSARTAKLRIIECAGNPEVLSIDAKSHNLQSSHASELADTLVNWSARTSSEYPNQG